VSATKSETIKKPRGMAGLASTLAGRADNLARRSVEPGLATVPTPDPPPLVPAIESPTDDTTAPEPTAIDDAHDTPNTAAAAPVQEASAVTSITARRSSVAASPPLPLPVAGPEGKLEASGEVVHKWTLELAPQLITALAVWERDETRRLGQRVFRERIVDLALDLIPRDIDEALDLVAQLPAQLRYATGQQFGTRVRASVRGKLIELRPEMRLAGVQGVRIRDIYSAGIYRYLTGIGVEVDTDVAKPSKPETEKPRQSPE
jgi:hypothetical protein